MNRKTSFHRREAGCWAAGCWCRCRCWRSTRTHGPARPASHPECLTNTHTDTHTHTNARSPKNGPARANCCGAMLFKWNVFMWMCGASWCGRGRVLMGIHLIVIAVAWYTVYTHCAHTHTHTHIRAIELRTNSQQQVVDVVLLWPLWRAGLGWRHVTRIMQNATNYNRIIALHTYALLHSLSLSTSRALDGHIPLLLGVRRSVARRRRRRSPRSSPAGLLRNLTMHTLPAPKTMAISNAACLRIRVYTYTCIRNACAVLRARGFGLVDIHACVILCVTRILCVSELRCAWPLSTSLPSCRRIKARVRAACAPPYTSAQAARLWVCVFDDVLVVLVTIQKRARVLVAFARYDRTDRAVEPYTQMRGQSARLLEWTCEKICL